MERIIIHRATPEDTVTITVLASATFYEAYFEQDESANLARYINESFQAETVRAEIVDPLSTFFIVYFDGNAVGYARLIETSTPDCIMGDRVIELKRIYILERVWKIGIGKRLLEHCIDNARHRGFSVLWLGVWDENVRAQKFYARFGFRQVGTVTFPYGDVVGINLVLAMDL